MYSNNTGNGSSLDIGQNQSKKNSNIELIGGIRKNKESESGEKRERSGSKRKRKESKKNNHAFQTGDDDYEGERSPSPMQRPE